MLYQSLNAQRIQPHETKDEGVIGRQCAHLVTDISLNMSKYGNTAVVGMWLFIYYCPENSVFPKVLFSVAFVCCAIFVSNSTFFTRNIQETSTKLSGIICRPLSRSSLNIMIPTHFCGLISPINQFQIQIQSVHCHLCDFGAH